MTSAHFSIRSSDEAALLMLDAAARNVPVSWRDGSGRSGTSQVCLEAGRVAIRATGGETPEESAELAFTLYGLPIHMHCRISEGAVLSPVEARSRDQRGSPRVVPSEAIHLEWYSVEGGAMRVHRSSFRELGASGGRTFHPNGDGVPESDLFPATVSFGHSALSCMVEVRSRTTTASGIELGLRLHADGSTQLSDTLLANLFPRMTLRRHLDSRALIELFDRSGYSKLRDGCVPSEGWLKLDADAVSRDFVYLAEDGEPIGHGSITRAYRHTWIAHQIATLSHRRATMDARRDLYMALTVVPTLMDGAQARMIAYYDQSRSWHRLFFEEFVRSVPSSHAVITGLCRFERASVPLGERPALPAGMVIERANERDLAAVTALARSSLPTLLSDALDLEPASLMSDALHPAYRSLQLTRERTVFVARRDGQVVAAALCEHTARELSLFNIMNLAYLFAASPEVPAILQRALQHEVRAYYAEHGIADPLLVAPEQNFDATLDPHVQLAEVMGCITWSSAGLRAYENYVRLRAAWLQQRRLTGSTRGARVKEDADARVIAEP